MTSASDTITAALREGNLIALGGTPTSAQQSEGLTLLNRLLGAAIGDEAGQALHDLNIGGDYDQSCYITAYVPDNLRLVLNLSVATTLKLHPSPYDGQRLAVLDAGQTLATNNLTLDANGRRIEAATTLTLDTDGDTREWLYRADLGNWVKITDLALDDDLPFPAEFDDYFSVLLAMRLGPRYGQALAPPSEAWLQAMSSQLEARYRKPRPPQDVPSRALLGGSHGAFGNPQAFYSGRPWW